MHRRRKPFLIFEASHPRATCRGVSDWWTRDGVARIHRLTDGRCAEVGFLESIMSCRLPPFGAPMLKLNCGAGARRVRGDLCSKQFGRAPAALLFRKPDGNSVPMSRERRRGVQRGPSGASPVGESCRIPSAECGGRRTHFDYSVEAGGSAFKSRPTATRPCGAVVNSMLTRNHHCGPSEIFGTVLIAYCADPPHLVEPFALAASERRLISARAQDRDAKRALDVVAES